MYDISQREIARFLPAKQVTAGIQYHPLAFEKREKKWRRRRSVSKHRLNRRANIEAGSSPAISTAL